MKEMTMKKILLLVMTLLAGQADASVISADFTARAGNPSLAWNQGELVLQTLGRTVGAGLELGADATVSNPSAWNGGLVYIDLDPIARTLTLFSQDDYDFETFSVSIGNIHFNAGERITGLSLISDSLTEDADSLSPLAPTFSFTNNSLQIDYTAAAYFYFTGGSAVFQFETEAGSAVPEPATAGLLGLGLAGLIGVRRRKRG
jgi:hypothetical protein